MSHDRLYSFSWNPMATAMMCVTVANDLYLWWSVAWHRNVSFRWVYHHAQQTWQASKVFFLFRFPHEQSSTTFCPCIFCWSHKRAHTLAKLKPGRSQAQVNDEKSPHFILYRPLPVINCLPPCTSQDTAAPTDPSFWEQRALYITRKQIKLHF